MGEVFVLVMLGVLAVFGLVLFDETDYRQKRLDWDRLWKEHWLLRRVDRLSVRYHAWEHRRMIESTGAFVGYWFEERPWPFPDGIAQFSRNQSTYRVEGMHMVRTDSGEVLIRLSAWNRTLHGALHPAQPEEVISYQGRDLCTLVLFDRKEQAQQWLKARELLEQERLEGEE